MYLQSEIPQIPPSYRVISIMSAYNTDWSPPGVASFVDLILTFGFFVSNPSGNTIKGAEQVVLLSDGLHLLINNDSLINSL